MDRTAAAKWMWKTIQDEVILCREGGGETLPKE
jgi:hypothetical protein